MGEPGESFKATYVASGASQIYYFRQLSDIRVSPYRQTSIASRAIDGLQEQTVREEVHTSLLKYFDTDTIWYVHLMNSCGLRSRSHAQLSSRQPISAS